MEDVNDQIGAADAGEAAADPIDAELVAAKPHGDDDNMIVC